MINRLRTQMTDFARGGLALFWQRQVVYAGAAILTAKFLDVHIAIAALAACEIAEAFDLYVSRRVINWSGQARSEARHLLNLLTASNMLSAVVIAFYVIIVSAPVPGETNYALLFFLYSAGLFAAMNNHQIPRILLVRLAVYGFAFLFVPIRDLWVSMPNADPELWLQLGTSAFVLYFIINCSLYFVRFYQNSISQLEKLRTERDKARDAYEVQSQFVSVVSHELRTPLTSIRGALDLINSGAVGKLSDGAQRIALIAAKNAQRLSALIDDILDVQKLNAGRMEMIMSPVNLTALITDSVDSMRSMADAHGVRLEVTSGAQPVFVSGDYNRLMQVMTNILSNAIKFSPQDAAVEVALSADDGRATVAVKDHGCGIPPNAGDKVFGRFRQVDSTDQRAVGGTGLGMNISRQIMERHDGTIGYDSTPGEGTTFTISLATDTPIPLAVAS